MLRLVDWKLKLLASGCGWRVVSVRGIRLWWVGGWLAEAGVQAGVQAIRSGTSPGAG